MKTIKATIELPRCWKRLVQTEFDNFQVTLPNGKVTEVTSEHNVKGNDDPNPHYDECRTVGIELSDGAQLNLDLCSGQHNYYGGAMLQKANEIIYEGEPIETFHSPLELQGENGTLYIIRIKWVGKDPYAKK